MAKKDTAKVVNAFLAGNECEGRPCPSNGLRRMRTDGRTLWSYAMPIARWVRHAGDPCIELVEYGRAPSATTRSHVRAVETLATSGLSIVRKEAIEL